jgi:hypothetical protein
MVFSHGSNLIRVLNPIQNTIIFRERFSKAFQTLVQVIVKKVVAAIEQLLFAANRKKFGGYLKYRS